MSDVWLEEWLQFGSCVREAGGGLVLLDMSGPKRADVPAGNVNQAFPRARIAACAPEAVRLLMDLEWHEGGVEVDAGWVRDFRRCPSCDGCQPDDQNAFAHGETLGHTPDCRLVALLKKAGVR